jgi:hypothetical protein
MYLIFADLGIFGAEELSQKIKYGYRNYENYMHIGVHTQPLAGSLSQR